MSSRLVNVRLDAEHLRKAKVLRDRGIPLSDVVREAIDSRYGELAPSTENIDARQFIQTLFARFPDPDDLPPRTYDVHSASEARSAIRRRQTEKKKR